MTIAIMRSVSRSIGVIGLVAASILPMYAQMPIGEQNELVHRYCAVCHDDAHRNGGLSLQHFDAAHIEPSLAMMMVSKLNNGAIGAAGLPEPDKDTQESLLKALTEKSAGGDQWILDRAPDPVAQVPLVVVSIVREGAFTRELYRLKVSCRPETREGNIELTWAPKGAEDKRVISVAADDGATKTVRIEGGEAMANGGKSQSSAALALHRAHAPASAPDLISSLLVRVLSVSDILPREHIAFPFDTLAPAYRQELSRCFTE
jgi:hypothetical protein